MRLICPNCDAQYEVSDDAIPEGGRDVQCSNCGHTWFQLSPEVEAAMAAEAELFGAPENMPADVTAPAVVRAPTPEPEAPQPQPQASPAPLQRRSMDESLLAVLREEAEHEAKVRRAEPARPLETQPDLGLDDAPAPAPAATPAISPAARRIAQLKGIDLDAPPARPTAGAARPASGRELLPDIEEINSTLRASSDRRQDEADGLPTKVADNRGKSGFRSGFVLMMIVAVGLVLAYVMAPKIVQQIPGSADAMMAYVAAIDAARLWLDALMHQAIGALNGPDGPPG
ncbi:MAG: zinc-ribbon domain-containing protein [Pseudorhodobacter sp.]|nr:zinc-ribbon domain-containing protein [Pseudorhodobacter sp.]